MHIIRRIVTGDFNQDTLDRICAEINEIIRIEIWGAHLKLPYSKIYIGYTNSIERRIKQHEKKYLKKFPYNPLIDNSGYRRPDLMFVLYKTSSIKNAKLFEDTLIDFYRRDLSNLVRGKGGKIGKPPYYIYLLIEKMIA